MTLELFDKAFNGVFPQRLYGSPRNDVLLKRRNVNNIKKKLGIPLNSKVVLFAPTFRTDVNSEYSGSKQIQMFNMARLFNELNEHVAEGEWVFVYRCHHIRMGGSKVQDSLMIDGNQHDDMAEYLCCADVLITDYSSSMFDFAITKKPCFLFVPDIEYYRDVERGFMIPFESLPFPWGETFESFLEAIRRFDRNKYEQMVTEYLKKIGNHEDGRASERVVKDIVEFVQYGRKTNY